MTDEPLKPADATSIEPFDSHCIIDALQASSEGWFVGILLASGIDPVRAALAWAVVATHMHEPIDAKAALDVYKFLRAEPRENVVALKPKAT